jgi:hypoxanthine phosphoribosyltransferase
VNELGAAIARDYESKNPILVASLKSSLVFLADLSRALAIPHELDFLELAGYRGQDNGANARLLKDLETTIEGRHVLVIEDVVDTGLTLNFLVRMLLLRMPETLAAVTLLDRPYRRLVDDLPLRYVGFTVPDEFFVGYGFDLDERWRGLPDLRLMRTS